ncbi:T9SS type A sorting domain-containing protein [Pseudotenacibaculum sp. MALMAid0570]|uniref:T9SS type A sorting domain-containing protein n=1 Tax=Pseudotenacibaculum sp. MALMAid0570 TaxID=3143938 RepID=UPI0032DF454F
MKKITLLFLILTSAFAFGQAPTTNATDPPTRNAGDVISIFSDAYTNITVNNFDPNWGQSGHTQVNSSYDPGTGNLIIAYPNFNYQGTEIATQDASAMEFIHIDIFVPASVTGRMVKFSPINNGTGTGEFLVEVPITPGSWNSVDLAKGDFTGMIWDSVFQLKFDGQFNSDGSANATPFDIYVDNIYFWKNPTNTTTDATLSDLQVDGNTVAGFVSTNYTYNVELPNGTTAVPTVTGTATQAGSGSSNVSVSPAASVPGTTTVTVTAPDGTTMQDYTINFTISAAPTVAAPTPPARTAADVVSIFSDAYSDVTVDNWGPDWGPSSARINDVTVASNATKLMDIESGQVFAGIDFAASSPFDATSFTHFHLDYYISGTLLPGQTLSIKLSNHSNGAGETSAIQTIPTAVAGSWQSLDVALADFVAASAPADLSRNAIAQIVISAARADNSTSVDIYLDNIYFHKNTTLSTKDESLFESKIYPNPSSTEWKITVPNNTIRTIEVFNVLGKRVVSQNYNSDTASISVESLASGIYLAKINTELGTKTVKLIRE